MFRKAAALLVTTAITWTFTTTIEAATFSDVPESHSLYTEIEYLSSKGIINGYSDGTFQPNALMAKKHIAKMLVEALNLPTTNTKPLPYKDIPRAHAYYDYIAAAYTAGIFGHADYFKPESNISRAFMAKMLTTSFDLKSLVNNTVDYVDVPTSSEFYRPIQLVTMNDIARGYELLNGDGPTTYAFAPTNLLTRAHFSAFLARAMSITTGNYAPDARYTYFYETADDRTLRMELEEEITTIEGVSAYWNMYNDATNELHAEYYYFETPSLWSEHVSNEVLGTYVKKPFTIGFKYYVDLHEMRLDQYRSIVETKETYKIEEQIYRDVVVVRDIYWHDDLGIYTTDVLYIAKFYGVIAHERDGELYRWLVARVPS